MGETKPGIDHGDRNRMLAWPMELASVVCPPCVVADVHITDLYPLDNFDKENASGEMPETYCNLFKMIGGGGGRGPRN